MSKIVKTFFILLILSPVFAIQKKSDQPPQSVSYTHLTLPTTPYV